jgi:SAM-dependent methyltransferase
VNGIFADWEFGGAPVLHFLCPGCACPFVPYRVDVCAGCGQVLVPKRGVFDLLTPDERGHHASFIEAYARRRAGEGRGWAAPAPYLSLPAGGPGREWRLRTRTLSWLRERLGRDGLLGAGRHTVLDAGAGCCWLTRHLASWGLEAVGLDLSDDDRDGLGAGRHYLDQLPLRFWRARGGFERLPFPARSFDAVIFNGSLHYAESQPRALAEAARVLGPGGRILVLDSPLFSDPASGQRMAADLRPGERFGYLLEGDLRAWADKHHLPLELELPRRGPLGRTRERLTALRLGREPAVMSRAVLGPLKGTG